MPSPHPAACLTSCCTRICAQPQGRPRLGVEPRQPLISWAQARWAAIHPEVGQVCWWRWEHPNPASVGMFQSLDFTFVWSRWSPHVPGHPQLSLHPRPQACVCSGPSIQRRPGLHGHPAGAPSGSPEPATVGTGRRGLLPPAPALPVCIPSTNLLWTLLSLRASTPPALWDHLGPSLGLSGPARRASSVPLAELAPLM